MSSKTGDGSFSITIDKQNRSRAFLFSSVNKGLIELECLRNSPALNLSCNVDLGIPRAADKLRIEERSLKGMFWTRSFKSVSVLGDFPLNLLETSAEEAPSAND
jgi:hypothetical protein